MSKTLTDQGKKDFCHLYLQTLDPDRSADRAQAGNGYALLKETGVRRYLDDARKYARQEIRPEDVVRKLCQIAFSRPNDAIALACGQQYGSIENMDLAAVAEFKYKDENAEVKFVDRVRALQLLWELLGEEDGGGPQSAARDFLLALEKSAEEDEK